MKRRNRAMLRPRMHYQKPAALLITGLALLASATLAFAQSTPIPIPTGPGGGGTPIYVQPPPKSGTVPGQPDMSDPVETRARSLPTPPAADIGKAQSPRQITAFPEMTRGVGNSKALLGE